jgi:DNA (cytosine-5)-methyltransferase 1
MLAALVAPPHLSAGGKCRLNRLAQATSFGQKRRKCLKTLNNFGIKIGTDEACIPHRALSTTRTLWEYRAMIYTDNNPASPQVQDHADRAKPPPLTYGCVCSGISTPTLAAKPLGWITKFFSEIEAFPRAVLSDHYPDIPLHHDFTTINGDTYGTVDVLVGGTPCQSFSVAGKRLGLDDPRGNLALEYVRLAERTDAKWIVFENVPGLLSSASGEDFAAFVSAVTGHEYRPPATGWKNAGIAECKPGRWGIAWRILDAQYFGVAQRRRRVFVVGYRGDWRPAAAVLLESESVRGNPPPSREARSPVAALTATGVGTCGADDNQAQAGHLIPYNIIGCAQKGKNHAYQTMVSGCLQHKGLAATGNEAGTLIASTGEISHCLNAGGMGRQDYETETLIAHTLRGEGFDASEDGTGRGTPLYFDCKAGGNTGFSISDNSGTLRGDGHGGGHAAIAVSLRGREGGGTAELSGEVMPSIRASQGGGDKPHVLQGVTIHGTDKTATAASFTELAGSLRTKPPGSIENSSTTAMLHGSAVRRLTPTECERLQGMPDDYTLIPWRKKAAVECPDGPRYKAIGNSMAVPVVRWIFERLDHVHTSVR